MFLKKVLFLFLSIFLLQSCAHGNQNKSSNFLPIESFIHVEKSLEIRVNSCDEEKGVCNSQKMPTNRSTASAFVVGKNEYGSYAVSAAHVCADSIPPFLRMMMKLNQAAIKISVEYKMTDVSGNIYYARSLTYDEETDICLLFVYDMSDIEPVDVASKAPEVGDKVYNVAAPMGIFAKNMIPILEGRYSGLAPGGKVALFSLPVAPGSSGSMILNYRGDLIGVVHSVFVRFHHLSLGVPYKHTKHFIKYNIEKYELYKKHMSSLDLENIFVNKNKKKKSKSPN